MEVCFLSMGVSLVAVVVVCSTTESTIDEEERRLQARQAYNYLQIDTLNKDIEEQWKMIESMEREVIQRGDMSLDDDIAMCCNKIRRYAELYDKHATDRDRIIRSMLKEGRFSKGSGSEATRVEIIDVPELTPEDVVHVAHKVAAAIGVAQYGGIVSAYRSNSEDVPRPIVVQLASHHHKTVWLEQGEDFNHNLTTDAIGSSYGHHSIHIVDCVNATIWQLYTVADIVAQQRGYMQVRVLNNTVEVQRDPWHRPVPIRTAEDLRVFETDAPSIFLNLVELGGIPEREHEVPMAIARRVEHALGVHGTAVLEAFRRPTEPLPRPIVVVLRNGTDKDFWLEQRGVHNLTAQIIDPTFPDNDIVIDDLSMVDGQMYAECSLVGRQKGYSSVYAKKGRIYIQYNDTVEPIEIINKEQLYSLRDEITESSIIL